MARKFLRQITLNGGYVTNVEFDYLQPTDLPGIANSAYATFTPTGNDDEFDDESFTGWTAVTPGSNNPTLTEVGSMLSMAHPGGDAAAALHAWVKQPANGIPANTYVEAAFRMLGRTQNFSLAGLIFADGSTYGAGTQVVFQFSPAEASPIRWGSFTNYSSFVSTGSVTMLTAGPFSDVFLRFRYEGSNNWRGYVSCDGTSWADVTGSFARALTPTNVGFFVSTWGGAQPCTYSWRYVRFGS